MPLSTGSSAPETATRHALAQDHVTTPGIWIQDPCCGQRTLVQTVQRGVRWRRRTVQV